MLGEIITCKTQSDRDPCSVISTEGHVDGLCWAKLRPKGPTGEAWQRRGRGGGGGQRASALQCTDAPFYFSSSFLSSSLSFLPPFNHASRAAIARITDSFFRFCAHFESTPSRERGGRKVETRGAASANVSNVALFSTNVLRNIQDVRSSLDSG